MWMVHLLDCETNLGCDGFCEECNVRAASVLSKAWHDGENATLNLKYITLHVPVEFKIRLCFTRMDKGIIQGERI